MRVAIDSGPLKSGHAARGIGVNTRELIDALRKFGTKEIKIDDFDFLVNSKQLRVNSYDIVHYTSFHPYFLSLPFKKPTKRIVLTIHDLTPLIYPEHYPSGIRGRLNFFIQKILLKNVDAIMTISETSKKDIVRFLGIPKEKIFAIHLAPREIFKPIEDNQFLGEIKAKYKLPDKFVLYVGDVNYNKNLLGLIEACKDAKATVVIVGKQATSEDFDRNHPENRPLVTLLEKYGKDKDVIRLGFVDDSDLVGIYNLASLYCQPSFYEGFGLPVLEAFAAGCPVVAGRTQALVEIGELACLFADPKDPKDLAKKITSVLESSTLRSQLVETGKVLVKKYSWEKTARQTAEVYKLVVRK